MKKLIVVGAGGLAREVKFLVETINSIESLYDFQGFVVSDLSQIHATDSEKEIIGDLSYFNKSDEEVAVAIGIGTPSARLKIGNQLLKEHPNLLFPSLIHPNVTYDKTSCKIEPGTVICASCALTVNIQIKQFAYLNLCCTVGHETVIGPGCVLNPTVNVSGGVNIGAGVLVGTGAQILQYINVGENAIVGSGACVVKDVEPGITVVGIPAKPLVRKS